MRRSLSNGSQKPTAVLITRAASGGSRTSRTVEARPEERFESDFRSIAHTATVRTRGSRAGSSGRVVPARPCTVTSQPRSARNGASFRTAVSSPP
jgi:hypothetical protein